MNIGIVYLSTYPPLKGASGADRRVRNIARGLAHEGHQVHMLVPLRQAKQLSTSNTEGYSIHYFGDNTSWYKHFSGRIRFWQEVCSFALSHKLSWLLLYSNTADSIIPAIYLKKAGINIAAEFCDLRSSGYNTNNPREFIRHFLFKADEFLLPKVTNLNIVISSYLSRHLHSVAPRVPTMQLPILVDTDQFIPNELSAKQFRQHYNLNDSPVVAYVGSLWFPEGVRYLVEAFSGLIQEHPNAKLVIAGALEKSPRHDNIVNQINELRINKSVITTGWLDTSEVIALLSAADTLVLPQTNHLFSQAALPTKLAEYSAMGKAIIATSVGDVPTYFRHMENALLCEPENVETLRTALISLIDQPLLRKNLGDAAKDTAYETFDYRSAGSRISQCMVDVMSQKKHTKRT